MQGKNVPAFVQDHIMIQSFPTFKIILKFRAVNSQNNFVSSVLLVLNMGVACVIYDGAKHTGESRWRPDVTHTGLSEHLQEHPEACSLLNSWVHTGMSSQPSAAHKLSHAATPVLHWS